MLERLEIRCATEKVSENLAFNGIHEVNKHDVGVIFVFNKRIFLAERTKIHRLPEAIHRIEVLLPKAINGIENDIPLKTTDGILVFQSDLALIGVANCVHKELPVFLNRTRPESRSLATQAKRECGVDPLQESIDIRFVSLRLLQKLRCFFRNNLIDDFDNEISRILGIHDFVAVTVDDFALLVHDVIKFQRAFAH